MNMALNIYFIVIENNVFSACDSYSVWIVNYPYLENNDTAANYIANDHDYICR